jgi:four helix bundle protein
MGVRGVAKAYGNDATSLAMRSRLYAAPTRCAASCVLDRSATSIVLNIAERAGEFSRADKQRFYRMARRSATESAATLDIIARRKHAAAEMLSNARSRLARVVSMLVTMTQSSPKR